MARIVWTKQERQLINDKLFELFCIKGDMARKYALQWAQEVLAPGRRALITDQRVFNYKTAIELAQARAAAHNKRGDQPKAEKAPPAPAPINVPAPAPKAKEDPSGGLVEAFERLLDAIADRVADRVAERVLLQLPQATPARTTTPAPPVPNAPTRARPGVWLLGVQPQMGYHLRDAYRERLDIDYLDSDEAAKRTPSPRAHVVMMTRFVSHVVQERWKKQGMLHYCNGGLSALQTILDSL